MGFLPFLGGWTMMMAAMMLPSIAPLVLLLHKGNRAALASGYLTVWAATGLLPWAAMQFSFQPAPAIVLALAGLYELTPVKLACLRRCHNAASFLMERYKSGPFRLGIEHGLWCIACCAGLMVVLVLAASMNLAWAAGIAVVVFLQKVLPWPKAAARVTGVALLGLALVSVL
jgi:predicted metal-binding membrane protein